jgi:hypothetical protein
VLYVAFTFALLFAFCRKPEHSLGTEAVPVRSS